MSYSPCRLRGARWVGRSGSLEATRPLRRANCRFAAVDLGSFPRIGLCGNNFVPHKHGPGGPPLVPAQGSLRGSLRRRSHKERKTAKRTTTRLFRPFRSSPISDIIVVCMKAGAAPRRRTSGYPISAPWESTCVRGASVLREEWAKCLCRSSLLMIIWIFLRRR